MAATKQVLLVEGGADKSFFEKICNRLSLDTAVQVASPKDLGGRRNSKEGVFQRLQVLLPQLNDGQITHIALVVDADYLEHHGLGCQNTIARVAAIVEPFGFELNQDAENGLCFRHNDGLADLGLWVMPDNQQEGMMEDWIKSCIKSDEQALVNQAMAAVQTVEDPKFSSHLKSKADVATWLAWQKQPGHGLYVAINDDLLDGDSPLFKAIEQWLLGIFK